MPPKTPAKKAPAPDDAVTTSSLMLPIRNASESTNVAPKPATSMTATPITATPITATPKTAMPTVATPMSATPGSSGGSKGKRKRNSQSPHPESNKKTAVPDSSGPHKIEHKQLRPMTFMLRHKAAWTEEELESNEKEDFDELVDQNGIDLGPRRASGDPRIHSREQFLDTIRMDFQCIEMGLYLMEATMVFPDYYWKLASAHWGLLQQELKTCPLETVHVNVKFIKHYEPCHGPLELWSYEPPPQLNGAESSYSM